MATSLTSLSGNTNVSAQFALGKTTGLPGPAGAAGATYTPTFSWTTVPWAFGALAGQMNEFYTARLDFAAAPITLDLTALADPFGEAASVDFAKIKFIAFFINSTSDANRILFGAAAGTEWVGMLAAGSVITMMSGFPYFFGAPSLTGWPVNSGSKSLKLDPSTGAFSAEIAIGGVAA